MAAKDPKTGLTDKQEAFCIEFLKNGGNASAAYRAAYDTEASDKTVNEKASRLLKEGKVRARLQPVREEVQQKAIAAAALSKAWVLERLMSNAERCRQAEPVLDRKGEPVLVELPNGTLAPAFTFDASGSNRALELCGKEIGMFVDRKESGKPGEFANLTDAEVEQQAQEILAAGVKGGHLKLVKSEGKPPRKQA